jgi:hypothetical protein
MGYESSFHLVDMKIKPASISIVSKVLTTLRGRGITRIKTFLENVVIDDSGFLAFKASKDGHNPYVPDEVDGTVPALYGKWYEGEQIAQWLKQYSEKDGRMVFHSIEADGEAWGWEFDGKGRMRSLALKPTGKWE